MPNAHWQGHTKPKLWIQQASTASVRSRWDIITWTTWEHPEIGSFEFRRIIHRFRKWDCQSDRLMESTMAWIDRNHRTQSKYIASKNLCHQTIVNWINLTVEKCLHITQCMYHCLTKWQKLMSKRFPDRDIICIQKSSLQTTTRRNRMENNNN